MNPFDEALHQQLEVLSEKGLRRELRRVDSAQGPRIKINGRTLLNFSSNDYLGLANHPVIKQAAIEAVEKFGAGAGASRLICGSLAPFHELEETLAEFKNTEAALTFSNGYAAAIGTIPTLVGKGDIIVLDKLVHACIVEAARLSGAKLRIFVHNDLNDLEAKLKWAAQNIQLPTQGIQHRKHVLIVTESVFSMDGDTAPLREIAALKDKYGAWLMVDEAHATGLFGGNGCGLAEELGVSDQIEIQMGTLGKALGASGGYICGSRALIDWLVNRARSFIFSTAPVPAAAAAATAAIRLVRSDEGKTRRDLLWRLIKQFNPNSPSAIIPLIIGDETRAVELAAQMNERIFFIPAIRYPTVARGQARLRVTLTAAHSPADVALLIGALEEIGNRQSAIGN